MEQSVQVPITFLKQRRAEDMAKMPSLKTTEVQQDFAQQMIMFGFAAQMAWLGMMTRPLLVVSQDYRHFLER